MNRKNRELVTLVDRYAAGEINRRGFLAKMGKMSAGAIFGGAAAASVLHHHAAAAPAGMVSLQTPTAAAGGTVVAATIDKPVNMDPAFAELYSSMQVYQNIFSKLVYVDADYN